MQSTDIGCKGNLFLNKMVGSCIIVVPKLQYKSGLKQIMEKMAEKLSVALIKKKTAKTFFSWNITVVIYIVW